MDRELLREIQKDCVYVSKEVNGWLKHHASDYGFEDFEILDHFFMGYSMDDDGLARLIFQTEDDLDTLSVHPSDAAYMISLHGAEYFCLYVLGM